MRKITTRAQLLELAGELGTRPDWHEPDEQGLTADVAGGSFDNAGFWPAEERPFAAPEVIEMHVTLHRDGAPVAVVNLATLFAWAAGFDERTPRGSGPDWVDDVLRAHFDYSDPEQRLEGEALYDALIVADNRREVLARRDVLNALAEYAAELRDGTTTPSLGAAVAEIVLEFRRRLRDRI